MAAATGVGHRRRGGQGLEVEEFGHELGPRHTVDGRMVDLGDQPDLTAGQALDDVHLPRRLAGIGVGP